MGRRTEICVHCTLVASELLLLTQQNSRRQHCATKTRQSAKLSKSSFFAFRQLAPCQLVTLSPSLTVSAVHPLHSSIFAARCRTTTDTTISIWITVCNI